MRKALFLDRDGVVNVEKNYVYRIEDFEFIDGIFELARAARDAGYLLIVITNQAGIARGYYTEEDYHKLTRWMVDEFARRGIRIAQVYYCPFHPEAGVGRYKADSWDRKPNPGMLLRAKKEFHLDLKKSILVGDKMSDIEAGRRAGVGKLILLSEDSCASEIHDMISLSTLHDIKQYTKLIMNRYSLNLRWDFLIGFAVILVYFCYFVLPGLEGGFNDDDPYNLYYYWSRDGWKLLKGLIMFFSSEYKRPMGGVFFYVLYQLFGFNPFPFHVVITILLLINTVLAYQVARLLSGSQITAGFLAIFIVYHPRLRQLVYLPAFTFDVLCFMFYFSALYYYLQIRMSDQLLKISQLIIFSILYILALESKEMAVTLPVMVLLYEVIWHKPSFRFEEILKWLRGAALPVIVSGFLTLVFIIGRSIGSDPLSNQPAFQVVISWKRFLLHNTKFINEIFYQSPYGWVQQSYLLIIWFMLACIAWYSRQNHFKWALYLTVIGPLPIAFISYRGGACLYIPWFGWALIFSVILTALCQFISRRYFIRALPPKLALSIPLLLSVILIWYYTDQKNGNLDTIKNPARLTWSVKEQLEALLPMVKPGTKIAFMNDVFNDSYDTIFISELLYHDHSVKTRLNGKTPFTTEDLEKMDYVFGFEDKKLVMLKGPLPNGPSRSSEELLKWLNSNY